MPKALFKNKDGDIHWGVNAPEDYDNAGNEDVEKTLSDLGDKRIWRCYVCNDIHIGREPPEQCPTCSTLHAYCEIKEKEIREVLGL